MNVDHEDKQVTVYKAEITLTLSYEEALALSKQISEATRAYQREMESIVASEIDYDYPDYLKENLQDIHQLFDYPDYVKENLHILSQFKETLSREVALIDSCGTENTPVL